MNLITEYKRPLYTAALLLLALFTFISPASASGLDFLFGRKAAPGTELHALGTQAMEHNGGEATYFTNGKGRVLEVRARHTKEGFLRVSVNRTYIPENYDGSRTAESLYHRLARLAGADGAVKAGRYTLIDDKNGWEAYRYGDMVAKALDSE
ncbi:hypothetical protein [Desulfoluna spongiiphila]|uniref:hypothetical protein n=1 Tax=Desulfoluna spongiiphila TaxID=419481 RepID=UPI0012534B16|nr:hypothetical protein [Desulfoluna spongiiphila]VVS95617.1 hypothetical protein DBB_51940 [Desulfoluna spongiiphila]